jgi:hypothetical protein
MIMTPDQEARMYELLTLKSAGSITPEQSEELDRLIQLDDSPEELPTAEEMVAEFEDDYLE